MTDNNNETLLAYLAPRIAGGTENAAVEALGYILNRSPASREVLNNLVQTADGTPMEPVVRVGTQVAAPDKSRPDFVGFDKNGCKRVIGEAKFWAGLGQGQASVYLEQLADDGPAVLLFVVPDTRIDAIWADVRADCRTGDVQLGPEAPDLPNHRRSALVANTQKRLMIISWVDLLDNMAGNPAVEQDIRADIGQLHGLARREDLEAFMPIRLEELGPGFARRMLGLNRLIDEVVDARGVKGKWMTTKRLKATPQRNGYGRYFRFCQDGWTGEDQWFGVNCDLWAKGERTPLWLWFTKIPALKVGAKLKLRDEAWAPIYPKTGVEYDDVLDDVVSQLKTTGDRLRAAG